MLILTRRPLESVMVVLPEGTTLPDGTVLTGSDCVIKVTLLGVKGSHARVGFQAQKGFLVHREEIWERIQRGEISPPNRSNAGDRL